MTDELARRLTRAGIGFMTEGLEGIARLPGNPRRLRIERFGAAIAPASAAERDLQAAGHLSRSLVPAAPTQFGRDEQSRIKKCA